MYNYDPYLGYSWKEVLNALYDREFKERSTGVFVGICIFHKEKTGSLHLYPKTSHFYCYGCGAVGNMLDFITRYREVMIGRQNAADCLLAGKHFFDNSRQLKLDLPLSYNERGLQ